LDNLPLNEAYTDFSNKINSIIESATPEKVITFLLHRSKGILG